jgi:hypothetical protein
MATPHHCCQPHPEILNTINLLRAFMRADSCELLSGNIFQDVFGGRFVPFRSGFTLYFDDMLRVESIADAPEGSARFSGFRLKSAF